MNFVSSKFDFNDTTLVSCYDEVSLWSAPFGKMLLEMVEYRRSIQALDIGFGTGYPFLELAMRLGDSSFVYGIDPWHAAAERTAKKAKQYAVKNIKIIEGIAEHIPIDDGTINLIVSNNGLNNVSDLGRAVKECGRIAAKNCQFVVTMNLSTTMTELYDVMRQSFHDAGLGDCTHNIERHIREKR